jgi:hypothetical protein
LDFKIGTSSKLKKRIWSDIRFSRWKKFNRIKLYNRGHYKECVPQEECEMIWRCPSRPRFRIALERFQAYERAEQHSRCIDRSSVFRDPEFPSFCLLDQRREGVEDITDNVHERPGDHRWRSSARSLASDPLECNRFISINTKLESFRLKDSPDCSYCDLLRTCSKLDIHDLVCFTNSGPYFP